MTRNYDTEEKCRPFECDIVKCCRRLLTFGVNYYTYLQGRRRMQQIPPEIPYASTRLRGLTPQRTVFIMFTAVNLTLFALPSSLDSDILLRTEDVNF